MKKTLKGFSIFYLIWIISACGSGLDDANHVDRAQDYLDKGELQSASIELKNALRQNPDNMQARWLLGKLHLELGNAPAAEKELNRAKDLGVADELVAPLLAQALLEQGKISKVQELSKDNLPAEEQATVLAKQSLGKLIEGKDEDAAALVEEALSKNPDSLEAQEAKARLLLSKGEFAKARESLEAIFAKDPEYAPAWSLLGDIEQQEKHLEQALEAYNKAIDYRVNNLGDRLKRSFTLIGLRKFAEAQKDVAILLKQNPLHPGANYVQGLIHLQNENYQKAQAAFDLALTDKSRYPQALFFGGVTNFLLGNQQQATQYAEEFYGHFRNHIPVRKLLANIRLTEKRYAEAEDLLRPVVDADEGDVAALNLLANALMKQGKTDEAIELLSKVAALQPDSPAAQLRLGAGLLMSGEQAGGVQHIEAAVQLDPKYQQADILLILNHVQRKEYDLALTAAEAYRDRHPDTSAPYNLIGQVYLARKQQQEAEQAFQKARSLAPGDPSANHALASLALKQKDFSKARNYYRNVLKKHQDYLPTLLSLALLYAQENNEKAVIEHLQQAIAAHPKAVQPRLMLARQYLRKGKPEQVAPLFLELSDIQKNSPPVLSEIGKSQLATKSFTQAKFTLEKLVQIRPDSAEAHSLLARAHAGLNDKEAMKAELEKAVELQPKHFPSRLALTRVLLQDRDMKAVESNLKVLKELAPDQVDVVALEVSVARQKGDTQEALRIAETYYSKLPGTTSMLMLAAQKSVAGDKTGAYTLQKQWLEKHPDDLPARLALANMYTLDTKNEDAIAEYRTVLQNDEKNLIALNNLAWFLKDTKPQEALGYAKRANEIRPESADMMDTLAVVMLKNGQAREAQRIMDRVLKLAPQDLTMRYHSAMIDVAAGDISTAEVKLMDLKEEDKKFPEKKEAMKLLQELQTGR